MKRSTRKAIWPTLLVALAMVALIWSTGGSAGAPTKIAGDLDQVRNGSFTAVDDPPDWVNGNAGASNAHYREGQSIPYRLKLTGLPVGDHSVFIEYDVKHSGRFAIDYITFYDRIPENVIPCGSASNHPEDVIPGCVEPGAQFPIPAPPTNAPALSPPVPNPPQPGTSFGALPAAQKQMTSYNATVSSIAYIGNPDFTASQTAQLLRINISVPAANKTVVLSWGGHIASRLDWGSDSGGVPRSAGGISGSPYHTRLISLCNGTATNSNDSNCSGGNQDRSLSAAPISLRPGPRVRSLTSDEVC